MKEVNMNKIVTISREFGSGGRFIGEQLAKRLGIQFYDKKIISEVAEKTGLAEEFIEQKGEYAHLKNIFAYGLIGRNQNGESIDDILYAAQREILIDAVKKGPCVIVGRNADYIFKDYKECINVYICGNMKEKIARISKLYNKTEEEAKKLIHDIDKRRSVNYKYYTERQWGLSKNYTISLNSSEIGYEKCIDIIEQLYNL